MQNPWSIQPLPGQSCIRAGRLLMPCVHACGVRRWPGRLACCPEAWLPAGTLFLHLSRGDSSAEWGRQPVSQEEIV